MKITSNIGHLHKVLRPMLEKLKDREYLLRPIAVNMIPVMTERIHQDGKASDGSQIGTYSPGYMRVRTGDFQNSDRISRGPNKGKPKNAGTFTDRTIRLDRRTGVFTGEDKVGKARPRYNRSTDTKVIVSLTRQLENDWSVIATPKGYGIGFLNSHNMDKAGWVEETYNKKIFHLTKEEQALAAQLLQQLTTDALHS